MHDLEATSSQPLQASPEPRVFCVLGAEPEVQAYAMAKYSRSSLPLTQTLAELNGQKAEKFLNTFYFQYGHRSIADLAHLALGIERLSLLAATLVVDEQRWDGQERSTRYQDFQKSGYHVPELGSAELTRDYCQALDTLFDEYREISAQILAHLMAKTPRPAEMAEEAYRRTLKARAFDVARYLLPLATNTSLGQIVSARTLECQIARLLADPHAEARLLGELLKQAATRGAYDVNRKAYEELIAAIAEKDAGLAEKASALLLHEVTPAPTLVKYAQPEQYRIASARELSQAAAELMKGAAIDSAAEVTLLDADPVELELATTLLYEQTHYSYQQLREAVAALPEKRREEIIQLGVRHRGAHDELARAYHCGQGFRFDILMDIGGYRDMHRHRRCTQIHQSYCFAHGFDTPEEVAAAGLTERYESAMRQARASAGVLETRLRENGTEVEHAQYLIPLAYRKRTLFQMDLAEAVYISELRTGVAGHFSYRNIAWKMYYAVTQKHPALEQLFRVTDVHAPVDLLKR
jgi:thymidylate synthase ThyX